MKKLLMSLIVVVLAVSASAEETMDWSHVTSRAAAEELVGEGKLFKILLFPSELGGEDVAHNIVYVPRGIPEIKEKITGTLVRFAEEGLVNELQVKPEYKGDSLVPSKIHMKAWDSEGKHGVFEPTIDVW